MNHQDTETPRNQDVTRATAPKTAGTFLDQANELLARFPGVDRAELLGHVTALYLMDFRYGNKREERAACDFLNQLQHEAIKLMAPRKAAKPQSLGDLGAWARVPTP